MCSVIMSNSLRLLVTSCQAPLSMGFSRQAYWSGLPFSYSKGSSQPRDRTWASCVPYTNRQILYQCAIREGQITMTYRIRILIKKKKLDIWDIPGSPVVKTALPLQGVQVQSLVRELGSHRLHGMVKQF